MPYWRMLGLPCASCVASQSMIACGLQPWSIRSEALFWFVPFQ